MHDDLSRRLEACATARWAMEPNPQDVFNRGSSRSQKPVMGGLGTGPKCDKSMLKAAVTEDAIEARWEVRGVT